MFFYIIHEFVLKNKKVKNKKYINTFIFGSILYIISHAFINDDTNFLYNYMNYFYCIIALDIITFIIKEKLYKIDPIDKKKNDIIKKKLERENNQDEKEIGKVKESFNSDNSVFIKNYELFGNDEIITESFFNTEKNNPDKNVKKNLKFDSELIESSEKLETSESILNSESIEIKSNVISN